MKHVSDTPTPLALKVGLLGFLLLAIGLGVGTYGIKHVFQALREDAIGSGRVVALSLAESISPLVTADPQKAERILKDAAQLAGLAYVEVVNPENQVILRAAPGLKRAVGGSEVSAGKGVEDRFVEGRGVIEIPAQMTGGLELRVGLDRATVEARVRPARRALISMVTVESLLAILLVLWIARPFVDGLRRAERKYRDIFEHTLEGIFQTTPDGQYISANPALARIYGYDSPAGLIRGFSDIGRQLYLEPGRREEFRNLLSRDGVVRNFESQVRRKDGSVIWIAENSRAVYDDRGELAYYEGTVEDISERKQVERLKNEFVSVVSHELRTPLTSIRGSLGLIAGGVVGALPDAAKQMIDIAVTNTDRLVRLINDILDIEKIEAGKMQFKFKVVELAPLIEEAISSTRGFGEKHGVRLVLAECLPGVKVNVDADRLMQVLTNLLSNAAKFSPDGGSVEVAIRASRNGVRVSVTDHGPGIPQSFRDRIFQKFAQADSSDTRQKGGTGLGLSICKAIVERLRGEIGFITESGRGTTFHVDLPAWSEPQAAVESPLGAGRRVLVCEDDWDIARLLHLMLSQAGCSAEIAHSAAEAKALLASGTYDAMTLDLMLPGQDGISLIRELRSDPKTASLPIVVVSVKAQEGKRELNGDAFGVIDWISKPIDPSRLQAALLRATQREKPGRPSILHVEDDADNRRIVQSLLGESADVVWAENLKSAYGKLNGKRYDLVILDLGLPDGSGMELMPLIKTKLGPSVPVVIFSGHDVSAREAKEAAAALVKARTSNEQLLATIRSVLAGGASPS